MTLFEIIKNIERLAQVSHINTSIIGDVYDLNNMDVEYPAFVVTQGTHQYDDENDIYNLSIFFVDRLTEDKSNELDVQTWAYSSIESLIKAIEKSGISFNVRNQYIDTFTERFNALCAGAYAQLYITIEDGCCCNEPNLVTSVNGMTGDVYVKGIDGKYVKSINGEYGDVVLDIPTKTSELVNDSDFATNYYVDLQTEYKVSHATFNKYVAEQSAVDESQNSAIDSISGELELKANKEDVSESLELKADKAELDNYNPTNNFKTINNQSIIGTGNIDIKSGSGEVTSVNGMTGDVVLDIPTKTSELENDSDFATKNYVDSQTEDKVDNTTFNNFISAQGVIDTTQNSAIESISGVLVDKADKAELDNYNPTNNFKTINNESIIGTGNIDITSGAVSSVNGMTGDVTLDIPTSTSQLLNDSYFTTDIYVDNQIQSVKQEVHTEIEDIKYRIPTSTSQLVNDSGFVDNHILESQIQMVRQDVNFDIQSVRQDIPTSTSQLTNDSGYVDDGYVVTLTDDLQNQITTLGEKVSEIELFKFPNVTIFGTPEIESGQISGFTANDYIQFPFLVDFHNQAFEIRMCFTTGDNVTTQENILDSVDGLAFAVRNGKFVIAMSSDGTSWNMGEHIGSMNIQPNTTYYANFSWNKLLYKLEVSTDKSTYSTDIQVTDTRSLFAKQIIIGKSVNGENHFSGSINLNNCSLYIMGQLIWQGMDDAGLATRLATDLSNIDETGKMQIQTIVGPIPTLDNYYTKEEIDSMIGDVEDILKTI